MAKMKKSGAILLISLLAAQIVGITAVSFRAHGPVDLPDSAGSPSVNDSATGGTDFACGNTEAALSEGLPSDPDASPTEPGDDDTTEEIQLGGFHSGRTDPDEDLTAPMTTFPADDNPVTQSPPSEPPVTEAPETGAPSTEAPGTESPETGSPVTPPAAPLTGEGQGGLYEIADPDMSYGYKVVKVTGSDRDLLERLVMGEAGDQGYIGAAMVAQCIKDAMVYEGYTSVAAVRKGMKYTGGTGRTPNEDVKKAVAYIFDEGGYAVRHPMLYFYYSANGINRNGFHETQEFVVEYRDHRYFWKK